MIDLNLGEVRFNFDDLDGTPTTSPFKEDPKSVPKVGVRTILGFVGPVIETIKNILGINYDLNERSFRDGEN
jgi:hypothetical protein